MKHIRLRFPVRAFCLISIFLFPLLAFAQSGSDHFNLGVKAAKSGNYQRALKQFQQAKKLGLDTPALKYNLAVAYYKLGQFNQARKDFAELVKVPDYRQIAYFNLGLVANKQNDRATAVDAFSHAYQEGKSDKIRILAAEALQRLKAPLPKKVTVRKRWSGFLSGGFASDSNVTLANNDLLGVTSQSDTYYFLSGYGAYWLQGGRNAGTRIFLDGYSQNYSSQTSYNFSQLGAGIARYQRLGSWRLRLGGFWDEVSFGGKSYERILSGELRGSKTLSKYTRLEMRYRASQIKVLDPLYDYLEGSRQQLRVGSRTRMSDIMYRVYYQLELNNRKDRVGTVDPFTSYSPTRHSLRVTGWWDINKLWTLRLDGRYRYSRYNDDDILAGGIIKRREDRQMRLSARLSRELDKHLNINLKYTTTNSDSNIARKSYDRSLTSLGVTWDF